MLIMQSVWDKKLHFSICTWIPPSAESLHSCLVLLFIEAALEFGWDMPGARSLYILRIQFGNFRRRT